MSQKQTVTINNREYDARTGLPLASVHSHTSRSALRSSSQKTPAVADTPTTGARTTSASQQIHQKTQKSKTLNRKFIKKPTAQTAPAVAQPSAPQIVARQGARIDGIKRPAHAKHVHTTLNSTKKATPPLRPTQHAAVAAAKPAQPHHSESVQAHPALTRVHQLQAAKKIAPQKELPTASVLKNAAINEAMASAPSHHAKQHKHQSHKQRLLGIVFGCFALVMFGGYLTYLNVPNLSVRVAAAQAGIDATYPGYQPDGYKLNGPVAFSDGQVQIKFAANTGSSDFTLNQSKSSWDSSALLENYVKEKSSDEYSTSQEKGITIYSYGGNAAWVSGGILYTIDGDAPLSPDQIRKIATSV